MAILFAQCFVGELGWELINYAPHIQYLCTKNKFDEIHIEARPDRRAIYPMGTHFYEVNVSGDNRVGNGGSPFPKCSEQQYKTLSEQHSDVQRVDYPPSAMKFVSARTFFEYVPTDDMLQKWQQIPHNSVACCIRRRSLGGKEKNWDKEKWQSMIDFLLLQDLIPIIITKEKIDFELPDQCINLEGQTIAGDLIAIFNKCRFAVGQSTGTMHFASLCRLPHVVWGPHHIEHRYKSEWNPHKTMNEYYMCKNKFQCSPEDIFPLVDKIAKRIGENQKNRLALALRQ